MYGELGPIKNVADFFRVLTALVAMVAAGALVAALAPQAEAQSTGQCRSQAPGGQICLDTAASPGRAEVGERLTLTITESRNGDGTTIEYIEDTLSGGLDLVSAKSNSMLGEQSCDQEEAKVICPSSTNASTPTTVTIIVTPTQKGTFTNTARTQSTGLEASTTFVVTEEDKIRRPRKNPAKCDKVEKPSHVRKCHKRR